MFPLQNLARKELIWPLKTNFCVEFSQNSIFFFECIWKCCLHDDGYFVEASMC